MSDFDVLDRSYSFHGSSEALGEADPAAANKNPKSVHGPVKTYTKEEIAAYIAERNGEGNRD